jgi:DNA-binding HxlR family transcriptional regulator
MAAKDSCPVCRTAEVVCGKWTLLLIRDLAAGRSRFCELERSLRGISPRTLSLRLRALEEEGIVERHTYPEVPPRVEYDLTDKGRALVPLIEDMRAYGERWLRDCPAEDPADPRDSGDSEPGVEEAAVAGGRADTAADDRLSAVASA